MNEIPGMEKPDLQELPRLAIASASSIWSIVN